MDKRAEVVDEMWRRLGEELKARVMGLPVSRVQTSAGNGGGRARGPPVNREAWREIHVMTDFMV